jgi:hypothetical protein
MQLPTHLITAVMIDKLVSKASLPPQTSVPLVAGACFLSHGILDKMATATYHPPDPLDNRFWKTYHHQVLPAITRTVLVIYGPKHWFAMLFSALPDLDWVVRGLSRKYHRTFLGWDRPFLNEGLHDFFDRVPLINLLNRLPDLRYQPKGVLVELGLVASMVILIQMLDRKKAG